MGRDLAPFREGFVGAEYDPLAEVVRAAHELEQQVGVPAVVREVGDLIDAEQVGQHLAAEAP